MGLVNWGHSFSRSGAFPLDQGSTFSTYLKMINAKTHYNGEIVSVTNDLVLSNNGVFLVLEIDGNLSFLKITSGGTPMQILSEDEFNQIIPAESTLYFIYESEQQEESLYNYSNNCLFITNIPEFVDNYIQLLNVTMDNNILIL